MRATIDDLDDVEGVGEARARADQGRPGPARRDQHPRPLQLTRLHVLLLTDGVRQRIEACTAALPRTPARTVARSARRTRAESRSVGSASTSSRPAAARLPDIDWMQHVSRRVAGRRSTSSRRSRRGIGTWALGRASRSHRPTTSSPSLARLVGIGARARPAFIDTLWAGAAVPSGDAPSEVEVRVVEAGSDEAELFARVHLRWSRGSGRRDRPSTGTRSPCGPTNRTGRATSPSIDGEALGAAALAVGDRHRLPRQRVDVAVAAADGAASRR